MINMVQIDKIVSEVNGLSKEERIYFFNKIDDMFSDLVNDEDNEEITLESAFGLWKDRNITKESLRQKAWR